MIRLDHLAIPARNVARPRDWYVSNFGFEIEMEIPERKTVGLNDEGDLTLFRERRAAAESSGPTRACGVDGAMRHR